MKVIRVLTVDILPNIEPINIAIVIIILILLFCFIANVNYFNIFNIIKNYVGLFRERDNRFNIGAIGLAFIVPLLLAIVVVLSKVNKPSEITNEQDGVTLVITILTAMFFTILGFILEINSKIESSKKTASDKSRLKKLSDSIFYANMFEILMCIFILIFSFINSFTDNFTYIINFAIYWISFTVIINMLMLIKRLFIVFNELIK